MQDVFIPPISMWSIKEPCGFEKWYEYRRRICIAGRKVVQSLR
ncbi:hypothetical protein TREVI0001_0606 [Treponema vincentii ATCC 35580]|uniref:Uncharacterized protein n=1 Tax=Treponema vincentii ATCC 35580 TaxID=596324 RepID=C8PMJ1_9SPIR|nr:hypothetical protein TREVI0001_0606 [Treponema vincentii ATCC 35580]